MLRDLERVLGWIMAVACCAVAVLTYLALTREARGQGLFCAPRSILADQLARVHRERLAIQGQAEDGSVLEIYATEDGRTWTLVRVGGQFNNACVLAAGQYLDIKAGALSGRGL